MIVDDETYFTNPSQYEGTSEWSILRTSLLRDSSKDPSSKGLLGAFQAAGNYRYQYYYPHAIEDGTRNMAVRYRGTTFERSSHVPEVDNVHHPAYGWSENLEDGMREGYEIMTPLVRKVASDPVVRRSLEASSVRHILRATLFYRFIQSWLTQPDEATTREAAEARALSFLDKEKSYLSHDVRQHELGALMQDNVPIFYSRGSSRDLFDMDGNILQKNLFARSSINAWDRHLDSIDSSYVNTQAKLVQRTLASSPMGLEET